MAVTSKNLRTNQKRNWSNQGGSRTPSRPTFALEHAHQALNQDRSQRIITYSLWIMCIIALSLVVGSLNGWISTTIDDIRYGRPRVSYHTAHVGHEADSQSATEFMAINLNRRVVIVEFPGGDAAQARTIVGPYLFGANEDLTPVTLNTEDINGDSALDLLVNIKNEQLVYINDQGSFRLITTGEQHMLE